MNTQTAKNILCLHVYKKLTLLFEEKFGQIKVYFPKF